MAKNSMEICNKIPLKLACSSNSTKNRNLNQCSMLERNYGTINSITNTKCNQMNNKIIKNKDPPSPYLNSDFQVLSKITDKRIVHRKATDFSSLPLKAKLYKANSDEIKPHKKTKKKVRESVLTIPNEPAPITQEACTVSDMNDSEYYNKENEGRKTKIKKRLPNLNRRKASRSNGLKFYDRDAKYCSQFNMNLGRSSTDMLRRFDGDYHRPKVSNTRGEDFQAHNIWTVLKNINRFQFIPSPPMSDKSIVIPNKKLDARRGNNKKEARFIVSSRTEESSYISSIELDSKYPNSFSQSSSWDRVTVIDKKDEFCKIYTDFEKKFFNNKLLTEPNGQNQVKVRNKRFAVQKTIRTKENIPSIVYNRPDDVNQSENLLVNNISSSSNDSSKSRNVTLKSSTENTVVDSRGVTQTQRPKENSNYSENSTKSSEMDKNERDILDKEQDNKLISSTESAQKFKGITKVTLSKGQNITLLKRMELQKPKYSLNNRMTKPGSKISDNDTKMKFDRCYKPLASLHKNEVDSSIDIYNYEAPQFNGLDKHIWPFMIEWYKNDKEKQCSDSISTKDITNKQIRRTTKELFNLNKQLIHKHRTPMLNIDVTTKVKKVESRQESQQQNKKQKPIHQFKDKIIKFLYRKQSSQTTVYRREVGVQYNDENSINKVDTVNVINKTIKNNSINKALKYTPQIINRPWSKAKRTNDFIDSIINKLKNGVYYINEYMIEDCNTFDLKSKEASTQAILTTKNTSCEKECLLDSTTESMSTEILDPLRVLGYEAAIPALEIEKFDKNKVSIKNCLTNITFQFDVMVRNENNEKTKKFQKSLLLPKEDIKGTKLFKYKILSAMLPAQLCSIISNMIRNMNTFQNQEILSNQLSTISELSCTESPLSLQDFPIMRMRKSSEISHLIEGTFVKMNKLRSVTNKPKRVENITENHHVLKLLPKLEKQIILGSTEILKTLLQVKTFALNTFKIRSNGFNAVPQTSVTTALVPYASNRGLLETPKQCKFPTVDIIRNYYKYKAGCILNSSFHILKCTYDRFNNNVSLNFNVTDQGIKKHVNVTITNLNLQLIINKMSQSFQPDRQTTNVKKSIEYFENLSSNIVKETSLKHINTNYRQKKKPFVTLYRKCKSTSNVSVINGSNALSKILNIEDFCELIGSKSLASVFDSIVSRKILSSLTEIQKWVSEINSRQALLILLLMNKKTTPNLKRFGSLILQGIAMNRITRVIELDAEIDVIERENMNNFLQASEYQMPFDVSNSKLEELSKLY